MFFILFLLEAIGIMLFAPALASGVITIEKERNTFGLLILTKLGPWTILLEKLLGRIILITSFLLISLPLFGFCYALGGMEATHIIVAVVSLCVTIVQLSALGVLCSCFFRTTVSSFVASYIIGAILFFGPVILIEILDFGFIEYLMNGMWYYVHEGMKLSWLTIGSAYNSTLETIYGAEATFVDLQTSRLDIDRELKTGLPFCASILVFEGIERGFTTRDTLNLLTRSVPALLSAFAMILASRLFILRRAFVAPKNRLFALFRFFDGIFSYLNQRYTKGIVVFDEQDRLPEDEPITWRETTKTTLGTVRYLVRIFLGIEFPVAALCLLIAATSESNFYRDRSEPVSLIVFICWVLAILLVAVRGATLVSKERSHETLDVLLTTPISSREFIRQKFKGMRRLMIVVAIPLLTAIMTQTMLASVNSNSSFLMGLFDDFGSQTDRSPIIYVLIQFVCILIYLPMIGWLSFLMGLWMNSQAKAIVATMAVIVAWIVLPVLVLISVFEALDINPGSEGAIMLISSPAAVVIFIEFNDINDLNRNVWIVFFLNTLLYVGFMVFFRWWCIRSAAHMLGRSEAE